MQNFITKTVREIALELPITTRVFEEFKIDYCCGGRKMFLEACRNVGANPEIVLQKIDDVLETGGGNRVGGRLDVSGGDRFIGNFCCPSDSFNTLR